MTIDIQEDNDDAYLDDHDVSVQLCRLTTTTTTTTTTATTTTTTTTTTITTITNDNNNHDNDNNNTHTNDNDANSTNHTYNNDNDNNDINDDNQTNNNNTIFAGTGMLIDPHRISCLTDPTSDYLPPCHSLPPSEIDWGLLDCLLLQAQEGNIYFTELAERVESGNYDLDVKLHTARF